MVKDYFQDIVPPEGDYQHAHQAPQPRPIRVQADERSQEPVDMQHNGGAYDDEPETPVRGIRNISMPPRPPRVRIDDELQPQGFVPPSPRSKMKPKLLWVILVGGLALFALRTTVITVTPRSHTIVFDQTSQFSSYPASSAATGTLPYTVTTFDLQDSAPVPANGSTHVDSKASGDITVYNNYSASPVKLIANTRFATPDSLIFRTPAAIVIPGKTASGPGSVTITVVADQAGQNYNVGPVSHFTVPGLQSIAAEYAGVYAASTKPMSGGFSGDTPSVDPTAAQAAVSTIRARLESKAHTQVADLSNASSTVFSGLIEITYQDLPSTLESDGKTADVNEVAHISVPVFPADVFAETVAHTVAADTQVGEVYIVGGTGYDASYADASNTPVLGTDPISITLSGTAQIVWNIDTAAITKALAGRDASAFQTVISGFPGINQAHARIEPFWKTTFPSDPSNIRVDITAPSSGN